MKSYRKLDKFYIQEDEEKLIKYILPGRYVEQNLDKIDATYAIRFLQNKLNELLQSFVNGGFSYKGYLLFPLIKGISKNNINDINKLKDIAIFLNKRGYDFSNSINAYKNNPKKSLNFVRVLSSLYRDFSSIRNENVKLVKKPRCKEFDFNDYKKADLDYLKPLAELKDYANKNLRQYLAGFYLHGSLATKDYIKEWSDADTFAIVSKETISDANKLLELRDKMYRMRYYFYKIDPLQHHGSIVISEYDLQNYCNVYFPIEIFGYSKSIFSDKTTNIKLRGHSQEALAKLFWFANYFRKLKIEKLYKMGSYDVKNFLHCIMLFPAIYLNAKNVFVYKKFSFNIAREEFRKNWKVIDEASAIRKNWRGLGKMPLLDLASKVNPLLAYQLNSRVIGLFRKKDTNIKNLVESMFKLSEEAWLKTKQNAKTKRL